MTTGIAAVDLFCGVGGLTYGLARAGIDVRAGIDMDPNCRFAYESNNAAPFIQKSVADVSKDELNEYFGGSEYQLLAGCAPCQPFSKYSHPARNRMNPQWSLLHEFGRLVKACRPTFVTMENVPQLAKHYVFLDFLRDLESGRYHVWWDIVPFHDFGVPQTRRRLVLMGSRLGRVELKNPQCRHVTVEKTIGNLPEIAAGEISKDDSLHDAAILSKTNLRRIRQSKPGGTWRDWDDDLIAECHQRVTGGTFPSVYGRMQWGEPTIRVHINACTNVDASPRQSIGQAADAAKKIDCRDSRRQISPLVFRLTAAVQAALHGRMPQ